MSAETGAGTFGRREVFRSGQEAGVNSEQTDAIRLDPPQLNRKRSNSLGRANTESTKYTLLEPESDDEGNLVPPTLTRKRSNSIGDTTVAWAGGTNADPSRAGTVGHAMTPRAARHDEVLEWEDQHHSSGAGAGGSESDCIRVAVRFRPLSDVERSQGGDERHCVKYGGEGRSCTITVDSAVGKKDMDFSYNHVFQPDVTQADIYTTVGQPIVNGVINGFNGAILAYGQTGSGKTHTMLGPAGAQAFLNDDDVDTAQLGLIPRCLQDLVDHAVRTEGAVQLRASYVEVYMEKIIDLLSPKGGGQEIQSGGGDQSLHLPMVTQTPIASVASALEIMRAGNRSRHVAETKMNQHSSRSHAVFVVTVTNSTDQAKQRFAQLYLVDLAGSERIKKTGVDGKQLDEAKDINKSLLALGQVIWSLAHKHQHIPYRDSKLTLMLKNCLGGNARTAIMIAASPHEYNAQESLSALRFGARASLVQNAARMNVAEDPKELKRLLERARADLSDLRIHCRRLQQEVAAMSTMDSYSGQLPCLGVKNNSSSSSTAPPPPQLQRDVSVSSKALQALTAKRLLVWGLMPALVCPINRAVMRDPVVASDGWTYERLAIEKHFRTAQRSLPLSPVTGQRMTTRYLVPNHVVKQLVKYHLPDLQPPEVRLPMLALLHCWHVHIILSFLDGRSLARCENAWSSFLAASGSCNAWANVLRLEFPDACPEANDSNETTEEGDSNPGQSARKRYGAMKAVKKAGWGIGGRSQSEASKGLVLFQATTNK